MHVGLRLGIPEGSEEPVCLGERAPCRTGDRLTPPLHHCPRPRVYELTAASFGQQHVSLSLGRLGREDDSEGCLNHRGFPWARLDLGTSPCHTSGQGRWMGKELLALQTCSPRSTLPPAGLYTCSVATGEKRDRGDAWHV